MIQGNEESRLPGLTSRQILRPDLLKSLIGLTGQTYSLA
jgi:hypothetical protein